MSDVSRAVSPPLESPRRWLVFTLSMGVSCLVLASLPVGTPPEGAGEPGHWSSLLPPILAVVAALCFRSVVVALFGAFLLGAALNFGPSPVEVVRGAAVDYVWKNATGSFNASIFGFLFTMVALIHVALRSGGIDGMVAFFMRLVRGPRSARLATVGSGLVVFFDDYANTVIVGRTMRSLTDRWRVSREKLAYLIDSTTAPVAGLAIISTWIAFETFLLGAAASAVGLEKGGYQLFVEMLPYRFYCIGTLFFLVLNSIWLRDFGPMLKAERRAATTGALWAADARIVEKEIGPEGERPQPRARFMAIPLGVIAACIFAGVAWVGSGVLRSQGSAPDFGSVSGWQELFGATVYDPANPDGPGMMRVLFGSALVGLMLAILMPVLSGVMRLRTAGRALLAALPTLGVAIFILTMAWSMKTICENLGANTYLLAVVGGHLPFMLVPAIVFLLAAGMAFATGTSWGTMGVLIPIMVPLAWHLAPEGPTAYLILLMTGAAVLDGAIFGDHCSPISDTTVLSSLSTGCDILHHVSTQLVYALVVMALAALLGYLPTAFGLLPAWSYFITFPVAASLILRFVGRPIPAPAQAA